MPSSMRDPERERAATRERVRRHRAARGLIDQQLLAERPSHWLGGFSVGQFNMLASAPDHIHAVTEQKPEMVAHKPLK